jgi:uncharacterized protein YbjT (DUF2867 family)
MVDGPVLVTGATGRMGRAVIDRLLGAGVRVRAVSRRPDLAGLPSGVEVMAGDVTAPESLDPALQGAGAALLTWPDPSTAADAVVDRLAARVPRVVFLSAPHRTPHPFFQQPNPMAARYAEIERQLEAADLDATIIRPGMFASNALFWWAPAIRAGAAVRWPYADAETAPVDDRDVAAVIATVLTQDGHAGGDYVLTGPEPLSQAEQVHIIGAAIGHPVDFRELTPDEFRRETAATWPRTVVDMLLAAWQATTGVPAYVTSEVSDVLGAPARTFRQWATDHVEAFR